MNGQSEYSYHVINIQSKLAINRLLCWTALIATVGILPSVGFDPINLPKLVVLSVGGFIGLGLVLPNFARILSTSLRWIFLAGLVFLADLTIVLIVSGANFSQEFFGTFGRSTGYLAYSSLTFLMLASAFSANSFALRRISWSLIAAGSISVAYGMIQALNMDPVNWVNPYSPVIGFLGNPNFQASFIGFTAVMAFAMLIGMRISLAWRSGFVVFILLALYVIRKTDSQQGFLVFAGGAFVVTLFWIWCSRFKKLSMSILALGVILAAIVAFGSINSGPLASILFKDSVTYRGDYWRAGWNMTREHPLFGVGLDSYGDWYRRARTLEATLRRGPDMVSNAAHNVILDFSSNGGFPLVILYLLMMSMVCISIIKLVKRTSEFDPFLSGLIAVWIAYQAQSIISLNQLGLAVWGWIISGLIIGYEISTHENESSQKYELKGKNKDKKSVSRTLPKSVIGGLVGFLLGFLLSGPALLADIKTKSALGSGNAVTLLEVSDTWPQDPRRSVEISFAFYESNLSSQAFEVLYKAKGHFPDSFEVWRALASLPDAPVDEVENAFAQMKRLDPLNPNLK